MTHARAAPSQRALILTIALGAALSARVALGGGRPAASVPAALVFVLVLGAAAVWGGFRPAPIRWAGVALGAAAGGALIALSLVGLPAVHLGPRAAAGVLAWWVPLVTAIAALEELVLRGVLYEALRSASGDVVAVALTAILFALLHLPLYGMQALGVDLCAGVLLGCLRMASGGVAAPLVAHVLADLGTGWVG